MALLVISLSIFPCCGEKENVCEPEMEAISDHPEESADHKPCSPFFTCGACIGFSLNSNPEHSFLPLKLFSHFKRVEKAAFFLKPETLGLLKPPRFPA